MASIDMLNKIALYYNTLKYLKPIQIYGRIFSFLKKKLNFNISVPADIATQFSPKTKFIQHDPWNNRNDLLIGKFCFLNERKYLSFPPKWNPEADLLWKFNLHYFHYLFLLNADEKEKIIINWIEKNPIGIGTSWHPYVISLRLVNWLREDFQIPLIIQSIYIQAEYLFRNREFYHPANHYLENAKALIFAGLYFDKCGRAEKWFNEGIRIYLSEASAQILDDGVYFEKSTMYHAIMLEGVLDIINILPNNDRNITFFKELATKMLGFLIDSTHPDNKISLLNDSTYEISPSSSSLITYAKQLGIEYKRKKGTKYYPNAKILTYKEKDIYFIIKGGRIGPHNIPAHAHADIFNFELSVKNERIIVDTGVYEYKNSEMRKYCRSTNAHNCITIDNLDQAEMWSTFRVGRRYDPYDENYIDNSDEIVFSGSFNGYSYLIGDDIFQKRTITYSKKEKYFTICDELNGKGHHQIISNLHFHPSIKLSKISSDNFRGENKNINFDIKTSGQKTELGTGLYFPEFGKVLSNQHMMVISKTLPCKLKILLNFN